MTLKALMWKDARIFGDVFAAGVALLAGSYFMAFLSVYADSASGFAWSKAIAGGASLTRFSSILICALLGAYAFARESEDRSLLFLSSLPARRKDIVLSKVTIAATFFLVLWIVSLAIMVPGIRAMGYEWSVFPLILQGMLGYVASGVMAFGVAWALSLFMGTPIAAAFAGLMALMPVYAAQFAINWRFNIENPMFFHPMTIVFMVVVGFGGAVAGSAIYLRFGGAPEEFALRFSLPWTRRSRQRDSAEAWSKSGEGERPVGPMRALLWKDARLLRAPFMVGFFVLALPYLAALAGMGEPRYFCNASVVSMGLSTLVFAFWSGHIMSAETASRTTRFLATLPAPSVYVIGSRLAVVLMPMIFVTAANLAVLLNTNNAIPGEPRLNSSLTWEAWPNAPFLVMGLSVANDAVIGFAVAWFLSARFGRPAAAIVIGVMAAFVGLAFWAALSASCAELPHGPTPLQFVLLCGAGAAAMATALLAAGCKAAARLHAAAD